MSAVDREMRRLVENEVERKRVAIENQADEIHCHIDAAAQQIERLKFLYGEDYSAELDEAAAKVRERLMKHKTTLEKWVP